MNVSLEEISRVGEQLLDTNLPVWERYRALFTLENIKTERSAQYIMKLIDDKSELLAHEAAYCLGQMQEKCSVECLIKTLKDSSYPPIVRHEAAEALGALEDESTLPLLKQYSDSCITVIAETCQLALQRIEYFQSVQTVDKNSNLATVDPAPPLDITNVDELERIYLDDSEPLFKRYRAMFSLRNLNSDRIVNIIANGLNCGSPLFKHEVAFVLGQIQSGVSVTKLMNSLANLNEHSMVRHECAIALGSILSRESSECLITFSKDSNQLVAESCLVALDMLDYQFSDEFQYANKLS